MSIYQPISSRLRLRTGIGRGPRKRVITSFVPLVPGDISNQVDWYDFSDLSTLTQAGGAVSQLNDKCIAGRHLVQATGASQPTTNATGLNNKNTVIFNNQFLAGSGFSALDAASGELTVVAVFKFSSSSASGGRALAFAKTGFVDSNALDMFCPLRRDAATTRIGGTTDASTQGSAFNTPGYDTWGIHIIERNATVINAYLNGTATQSTAKSISALGALTRITIGTNLSGTNPGTTYCVCEFAEILIYNRVLSTLEKNKLEGYEAWKYNLTSLLGGGHPYKSVQP